MFDFDFSEKLRKKLDKLAKKDKVLALIFKKKYLEVINKNNETISVYKNLKNPLHKYKRIHLDDKFILLFEVNIDKEFILFVDIKHHDKAYENE